MKNYVVSQQMTVTLRREIVADDDNDAIKMAEKVFSDEEGCGLHSLDLDGTISDYLKLAVNVEIDSGPIEVREAEK